MFLSPQNIHNKSIIVTALSWTFVVLLWSDLHIIKTTVKFTTSIQPSQKVHDMFTTIWKPGFMIDF